MLVEGYLFSLNLWYIIDKTPWSSGLYCVVSSDDIFEWKKMSKNKIVDLIVDAASDKILFKLISKDKIYTNEYENCRKNFDKFSVLLMNFLTKKQYSFKKIRNVFINQGPGKYTSIRTSMAIIKALQLVYGFNYYGFNNKDKVDGDYYKILQLFRQKKLIKNLIKPLYLS